MFLYLVQHAKAFKSEEDPERGITVDGRAETLKISNNLKGVKPDIHVIWHSGKKRARETAEIIGGELDCGRRIMEHTNLGPTDLIDPVVSLLKKNRKNIMIVGHLPYLARISSELITGSREHPVIKFVNSGIVCLERIENEWLVQWMMTPELIN